MLEPMSDDAERWSRLRERLAELERHIDSGFAISAEEHAQRLQARTQEWARSDPQEQPDAWLEVLCFNLSEEIYAVEARYISVVQPLPQFTPLPNIPPFVLGIVNVRGHIVSVLDLRVFFDLPITGLSDKNFLAVLQGPEMEFGLLIDRVLGITRIPRASLQNGVANLTGVRANYLLGVTPEQWTVLDGERLLADPSLRVNADE